MRSTVFALAARPGSGKTDFALNLALRMGKRGAKVLYFSMEMTNLQLMQRAASSLLRINGERIRDKDLTEEELRGMEKVLQNFAHAGRISFVQEMCIRDRLYGLYVIATAIFIINELLKKDYRNPEDGSHVPPCLIPPQQEKEGDQLGNTIFPS